MDRENGFKILSGSTMYIMSPSSGLASITCCMEGVQIIAAQWFNTRSSNHGVTRFLCVKHLCCLMDIGC